MKKLLIYGLAAGLVCAIGGTVTAEDDFSGYPDDLQIWTGPTTERIRDDGQLTFGDDDDVTLSLNASSALEIDGPVTFTEVTTSPGIIGGLWVDDNGVLWFNSTGTDIQVSP